MKVCIIGPVVPFRSGVARHTTAIAREMAQRPGLELLVYSFRRQYPKLLYPGEDDLVPGAPAPAGLSVDYCLDSINPFTWRKVAQLVAGARPDLVIMPRMDLFPGALLGLHRARAEAPGVEHRDGGAQCHGS